MTHYEREEAKRPAVGRFLGFDHLRFYVSNAKQAASFYCSRMGFNPLAYQGLETGNRDYCTHVIRCGKSIMCFSAPLSPDETVINSHLAVHGDCVKDIAFTVEDARGIYAKAISRGARSVREPEVLSDEFGSVVLASVATYGDVIHTLVERTNYTGVFLPGFKAVATTDPFNAFYPPIDLEKFDHVVGNMPMGELEPTIDWYEHIFDFHRYWSVDERHTSTDHTALRAIVVADWDEEVVMPMGEPRPGKRKSQVQEFLDYNGGSGTQHIAFHTSDMIGTLTQLKARGVEFLDVPPCYYELLEKRLTMCPVKIEEDFQKLRELNVLVDFDDQGYLLQIFTKPVEDRPTLYYEFIHRHNHNGFGAGNFKALIESYEYEQAKRGNYEDIA